MVEFPKTPYEKKVAELHPAKEICLDPKKKGTKTYKDFVTKEAIDTGFNIVENKSTRRRIHKDYSTRRTVAEQFRDAGVLFEADKEKKCECGEYKTCECKR